MPTVSFNTHFPGYDVLGEIGRSNARVLKARHIATGDLVAIKHFALNTDADTLRRFERESEIMTRMAHPNIVRLREVRLDADMPYIVLDYIEGGNVRQLLTEQGGLSVEMTIRLGLQVLNAFRLIHAEGIVHRDVKPENILYRRMASGELHFLLTDFGVARLHEQPVTLTGQSLMTYEYAAPEQFDNPRNVGESADYYALGVVLYECLTGNVPFAVHGETGIITFMNAVLKTAPPPPVLPSSLPVPDSLGALLDQLLLKSPTERMHNPDAVKLLLKQAEVEQLHHEHGSAGPPAAPRSNRSDSYSLPTAGKTAAATVRTTSPNHSVSAQKPRRGVVLGGVLAVVALLACLIAYWIVNDKNQVKAASPGRLPGASPALSDEQRAEAARLEAAANRRRFQEQVNEATKRLDAETFGGKMGFLGGVKGLKVQLKNPSAVTFSSVAVRVLYIKESGGVHVSKTMYFSNIGPGATMVRVAPDSPRGTRFRASVVRADALLPDSLTTTPLTP